MHTKQVKNPGSSPAYILLHTIAWVQLRLPFIVQLVCPECQVGTLCWLWAVYSYTTRTEFITGLWILSTVSSLYSQVTLHDHMHNVCFLYFTHYVVCSTAIHINMFISECCRASLRTLRLYWLVIIFNYYAHSFICGLCKTLFIFALCKTLSWITANYIVTV